MVKKTGRFTIREMEACVYIRCHECNQSKSFCRDNLEEKLADFRRAHKRAHEPKNLDRVVNSLLNSMAE